MVATPASAPDGLGHAILPTDPLALPVVYLAAALDRRSAAVPSTLRQCGHENKSRCRMRFKPHGVLSLPLTPFSREGTPASARPWS